MTLFSRRWSSSSRNTIWARGTLIECGRRRTHTTTPRGATVTIHHAAEVLTDAEGLSHALRRWLNVVVGYGGYTLCSSFLATAYTAVFFSFQAHQSYFFFSLPSFSFILIILIFFIQIQNFKNKRILIFQNFKIFSSKQDNDY